MGGPDDDYLVLVEFATEDAVLDVWERAGHVPTKGSLVFVGRLTSGSGWSTTTGTGPRGSPLSCATPASRTGEQK